MPGLTPTNPSLWVATSEALAYPAPPALSRAEVAVVGAGITGATAALLLCQRGLDVVLLEADRVAAGVTGYTTGKVSSLHGLAYSRIERDHGAEAARVYGAVNEAAIDQVEAFVEAFGIDCFWERLPAYTYTTEPERVRDIEDEVAAAERAGLPASMVTETELPFPVEAAVRFEGQAQMHARRYVLGLARAFAEAGGRVYEGAHVTDVDARHDRVILTTSTGAMIEAERVVLATHIPFLDRAGLFARAYPQRSYLLAAPTAERALEGAYLGVGGTTHTLRSALGGAYLVFGGGGHKAGQEPDTPGQYDDLAAWGRAHLGVEEIAYRWSAEDYVPADGLPYVGVLPLTRQRVFGATGYNKWGLSGGTAAAHILADRLTARVSGEAAELFAMNRVEVLASAEEFVAENLNVAKRFVGDRVRDLVAGDPAPLAPGEGGVVRVGGESVGGYRTPEGELKCVSLVCTHLGCHVGWNAAERTWDCPCHGSRFDVDGGVVHGPAVEPLEGRSVREAGQKE